MHRAHIQVDGGKIAKSTGNIIYLSPDVTEKFHPLALRYLFLGAHYRTPMNFSWSSLEAAQTAFLRLRSFVDAHEGGGTAPSQYMERFRERVNDDLDTPGALSVLWEMAKDDAVPPADRRAGLLEADHVLGLGLDMLDERARRMSTVLFGELVALETLPGDVRELVERRSAARRKRDWIAADAVRDELNLLGYSIEDAADGLKIYRRS